MALSRFQRAAEEAAERPCDHTGCEAGGAYRAPKSPSALNDHYWFCLDHVREYNKSWNYFSDMSPDEIEKYQRDDVTGHRPTWRIGVNGAANSDDNIRDDLGVFEAGGLNFGDQAEQRDFLKPLPAPQRDALAEMNLDPSASLEEIKARYKELAKKFHPDLNAGDTQAEEQFKSVNQAYTYLLGCGYS
jgi:DnaJ-domain-containing protein 1